MLTSGGGGVHLGNFGFLMFHMWCCGAIGWRVILVGEAMRSDWGGVLELVECLFDISWKIYVQYSILEASVKCYATVKTPCPSLCYLIFSWSVFMRYWASYLLWYLIPKSLTTRVNVIKFLLWNHNPRVIETGSYPNRWRCFFEAVCEMMPAWNIPYIPLWGG